jgi:hypothetical protein
VQPARADAVTALRRRCRLAAVAGASGLVAALTSAPAWAQAGGAAPARAAAPPVAGFFRRDAVSHAVLSPSGRHVAVLVASGKERRRHLAVIDLATASTAVPVATWPRCW